MAKHWHQEVDLQTVCRMQIVWENICWMCGKESDGLTRHHIIEKKFKPKKNMIIPLCRPCHDKVHNIVRKKDKRNKKRKHRLLETHKN